jgi:syntaxin-binding protein 1
VRYLYLSRPSLSLLKVRPKVIESITSNREPQAGFDAVYMLMPTSANIDRIIRDFSGGQQQYAAAHLFFIDGPSARPPPSMSKSV